MEERLVGALGALGAMICLGSFTVFIKSPSLRDSKIDPLVFQSYKSFACFATSWLVLLYTPLKLTWWGIVGAGLWVTLGATVVAAVQLAGMGPTQPVWSGVSILVSFTWGAYVFKEPIKDQLLSILAVLVMTVGMFGISWASSEGLDILAYFKRLREHPAEALFSTPDSMRNSRIETNFVVGVHEALTANLIPQESDDNYNDEIKHVAEDRFVRGVLLSVVVGLLNGSNAVPIRLATQDVGVEYVISFGLGAMIVTGAALAVYTAFLAFCGKPFPSFRFSEMALPALLSGTVWSVGNFGSIYATMYLGVSLGWPLVQCQLIVSTMWAIFFFKEVTDRKSMNLLLGSSVVVLIGASLLSVYGT